VARLVLYACSMHYGRSRTGSREDSVKRRQLEARRVPSLRPVQDEGPSTYRVHRPTGGRDVLAPLPVAPERSPLGGEAARPAPRAAGSTPSPAAPSGIPSAPSQHPVVEPLELLDGPVIELKPKLEGPVIELKQKRRPAQSTQPAPPARVAAGSSQQPTPAAPTTAAHQAAPILAPTPSGQATDLIPRWAAAELAPQRARRRRLGVGWWFALLIALGFFLASIALSSN
jgi:hypothetical protein